MKKNNLIILLGSMLMLTGIFCPSGLKAQKNKNDKVEDKHEKMEKDSREAKAAFIKTDKGLASLFKSAYGYVIFPNIGKGALVVGGAGGAGTVFEHGKAIGIANVVQVTVGAQAGGQAYREVIFFENKDAMERFTDNKLEFSAQMSAVAAKAGASSTVKYTNGVLVFTEEIGGLMFEASIGGQKFKYTPY